MSTFFPSQVTESGYRGLILHYEDTMTPRPFDDENFKVTLLCSKIEHYNIHEISPVHSLMVLRVKKHTMDLDFQVDTPIVRVSWD